MPELPEVETVRMGLLPVLVGNRFESVEQRRKDLRFPFPDHFPQRLKGRMVEALDRRAKYLLARLDDGEVLVMHLGMTGRFSVDRSAQVARSAVARKGSAQVARSAGAQGGNGTQRLPGMKRRIPKHEHIVFHLADGTIVRYADTRRFGYMDLIPSAELEAHALFKRLGVEPLSESLSPAWLALKLKGKTAPIKSALIDQRLIAGVGNIYACEALFRAGISPLRQAGTLATSTGKPTKKTEALVDAIKAVLGDAVRAGGSTLRDYVRADGRLGRFQHSFKVYGKEGRPCRNKGCRGTVRRIVQGGRSTFYCPSCQR
jgi:formamidopyrimidine-DNA glycosylase